MLTYNTYLTFDVQSGQMGDLFKKCCSVLLDLVLVVFYLFLMFLDF